MNDFITEQKLYLMKVLEKLGYQDDNLELNISSRKELGDYQYNGAMNLAKKYGENPHEIAKKIVEKLNENENFENINIAGPGFINISFTSKVLIKYINEIKNDITKTFGKYKKKKILIDYGGANVSKTLHVGHLRSANIGEALKRLTRLIGYETIGDVHLGDWGLPLGMVIWEIRHRYPNLSYFKDNYDSSKKEKLPITSEELESIYPIASKKAKEDTKIMEEAKEITSKLQEGNNGYADIWKEIVEISKKDIKKVYELLNTEFELWLGESDAQSYLSKVIDIMKEKGLAKISDGALIVDVAKEDDTAPIPPVILINSSGATLYHTTELATLLMRMENYTLDEIWYLTDARQSLHFKQIFRAAYKSGITPKNIVLEHIGFGTMNGKDGKPFKTRDGGVMSLKELYGSVYNETYKRLSPLVDEDKKEITAKQLAISTLKYADLLPNRITDYIFDLEKFCDMNGKTGPYLLYSTIRIKSLLNKNDKKINSEYEVIASNQERLIILEILKLAEIIKKSLYNKSLNEIAEFLYTLTNLYNNFYTENRILTEKDSAKRSSWLILSSLVYEINSKLIEVLGIEIPEKI